MRRTLLLTALIGTTGLFAQNFPFPTSNATWVQYFEVMITPPPIPQFAWMSTANFCVDGTDTLITGTSYTQLRHCNADYVGGLREEDGAVYFFPADSTQEYLLYDFGATVGDTLYDIYVNEELGLGGSSGWMGTRLVDVRVTAAEPNPNYGGRIGVQVQAIEEFITESSEWIEGMGCIHGLFTFNPINISEYWYGLDCFSHNDTTYWNGWYSEAPGTCVPQYMSVAEQHLGRTLAYPNPTNGMVRVEGMDRNLVVRDALARYVYAPTTRVAHEMVDIDLSALPVGLYTVQDRNGRVVRLSRE
ncbi:MAG: hypothetical protein JNL52_15305 [Flavobacteriales bacterium]|nr:hypothetical protein [Flavobacteriales bacterium]